MDSKLPVPGFTAAGKKIEATAYDIPAGYHLIDNANW